MGLFFWKNKNTPYSMMFKFQEKTKNKQKIKVSKSKMNQLYSALENETYYYYQKEPSKITSKWSLGVKYLV